jgi:hypothetical protein
MRQIVFEQIGIFSANVFRLDFKNRDVVNAARRTAAPTVQTRGVNNFKLRGLPLNISIKFFQRWFLH